MRQEEQADGLAFLIKILHYRSTAEKIEVLLSLLVLHMRKQ